LLFNRRAPRRAVDLENAYAGPYDAVCYLAESFQ
jgi:hypothetical protein